MAKKPHRVQRGLFQAFLPYIHAILTAAGTFLLGLAAILQAIKQLLWP